MTPSDWLAHNLSDVLVAVATASAKLAGLENPSVATLQPTAVSEAGLND